MDFAIVETNYQKWTEFAHNIDEFSINRCTNVDIYGNNSHVYLYLLKLLQELRKLVDILFLEW